MAVDATGAATSPDSIPTYNTAADNPSGKGLNNIVAAIQTALSARVAKTLLTTVGDIIYASGVSTAARLGIGTTGQVLTVVAGLPAWAPAGSIAPTHLFAGAGDAATGSGGSSSTYLTPIPDVGAIASFTRAIINDTQAGGNLDVGLYYSDDEATFTRVASTGQVTTLNAGGIKTVTLSGYTITPVAARRWYLGTSFSSTGQVGGSVTPGCFTKASSAVLPATLTGMSAGTTARTPTAMLAV